MATNCLKKLATGISVGCNIQRVGVKDIYLMHAEDVTFAYGSSGVISAATFANDTRSYRVEGYKQNIQVTASLKTTDASARVDASVTFKIRYAPNTLDFINSLASGHFYVLVVFNATDVVILGDTSPLECSSVDFDSNANARLVTLTLASPEGSAGNHARGISDVAANSIIAKSQV